MANGVIIVDDEKVSRDYIKSLISWETSGFELVGEAENAEEAMRLLAENDVRIALLDVFMPGENGVILSGKIAQQYPSVAMIAISSYDNYDYVRKLLLNGAHDYILKHQLNGEILLSALNATLERLTSKGRSDVDSSMRKSVEEWIFRGGKDPFEGDTSRFAVTLASIAWPDEMPENIKNSVREGIIAILEEGSKPEWTIYAIFWPPNNFVVCTKVKSTISEAAIQGELYLRNVRHKNNIKLVYNLQYAASDYSALMERAKIPLYVKKKVGSIGPYPSFKPSTMGSRQITMTLEQQKQLLIALSERNDLAAVALILDIYEGILENDAGARMIITKELLELLMRVSEEFSVKLDFIQNGVKLFEWAQSKSIEELADRMAGLYRQVIRESGADEKHSDIIKLAKQFVDENYMRHISLSTAAKHIGVSESYLSRIFRQETGSTFVEHLNKVRLKAAKGYLNKGMSIKDVVYLCGFKRYNYFFKVFKDYEGITPKEYVETKH